MAGLFSKKESMKNRMKQDHCKRCGTCCKKGGPSFHHEDRELIDGGKILSKFLYTIRKGELAHDNVNGRLIPVAEDIIKIKGKGKQWTCVFLDEKGDRCTIYDHRPMECRMLQCWDTKALEDKYTLERLTRKDLLSDIEGLWDLIEAHEEKCGYQKIGDLLKQYEEIDDHRFQKKMLELIGYDTSIRHLVVEKAGVDRRMNEFLFGRPLTETLIMFGLKLTQKDGKPRIEMTCTGVNATPLGGKK